jgi:NAD(P)-dependent dehydrogenase (short-subunit alcohol dehydrogenase family)
MMRKVVITGGQGRIAKGVAQAFQKLGMGIAKQYRDDGRKWANE